MEGAKNKRLIEWIKTALIALLAASALFLGWQTGLFNDFFGAIPVFGNFAKLVKGAAGTGSSNPGGATFMEAARPLTIVITNEQGERYGVRYDTVARNAVYERTISILGETLGSASEPIEISEMEWRAALSESGIYYEYLLPVKLSVLGGWLGARLPETAGDASIRRVCIAFGEERSRVYYQDSDSSRFFAATTALSAGKMQELDIYSPNEARFAFETGISAAENAPYALIMQGNEYSDIHADSAGSAETLLDITRDAMGHSNEIFTLFYPGDGSLGYLGTQFNIRVDAFDRVIYRNTDNSASNGVPQASTESEMIERARIIAADTIGAIESGAEIFYETLEYSAGGSCSVYFGYYIAGGCIYLYDDGYAARITFTGGIVSEMELRFRSYTLSGEYTNLPPERLALAAAGGEFMLCYYDTGTERLHPAWVRNS